MTDETKEAVMDEDAQSTLNDPGQDETGKYKAQADEYLQLLQRVQADFDNFRRRTSQEREDWSKYCSMRLAGSLLPILDNFERALQAGGDNLSSFKDGMELIYRQLKDVLEKDGVKTMDTVGTQFDPNFHEAVMQEPSDEHEDNTVIQELQKGYMLVDRVLRPAMVKVAKN
ncbi:MAG TPA: nucleotide exchange factor GrpE [Desulfobacteria bacterium]|nr:nucleotide exchange factor GrpE [Desulfobacteria bacterium]